MKSVRGKKLKIGIGTEWFYPKAGGVETHCIEFVNWLCDQGHEVHVFIFDNIYQKIKDKAIKLHYKIHCLDLLNEKNKPMNNPRQREAIDFILYKVSCLNLDLLNEKCKPKNNPKQRQAIFWSFAWNFYIKTAFLNVELIKKLDLDILHAHSPTLSYIFLLVGKMLQIPTVFTTHAAEAFTFPQFQCLTTCQKLDIHKCFKCSLLSKAHGFHIYNFRLKTFFLQNNIERIIAVSNTTKEYFMKNIKTKSNILFICNWVYSNRFKVFKKDFDLCKKYKINKDQKIILFCGRIEREKGIFILLRAFVYILEKIPCCKLLIIVPSEMTHEKRLIIQFWKFICKIGLRKKIILTGTVAYEDIPRYYTLGDVFVLPSLIESQGLAILEAMAAKVPVVVSALPSIKEYVKDGENGLLVNPFSPKDISRSVVRVLQDKQLKQKLVYNGYQLVKKKFSPDKIIPKIVRVYREEINKKKKS